MMELWNDDDDNDDDKESMGWPYDSFDCLLYLYMVIAPTCDLPAVFTDGQEPNEDTILS